MTTLVVSATPGIVAVPKTAKASVPVMAVPKAQKQDPVERAKYLHKMQKQQMAAEEQKRQMALRDEIVRTKGAAAANKFDQEYKQKEIQKSEEKVARVAQLKKDLLDQGICPFNDMEGERQMYLAMEGLDLANVRGSLASIQKDLLEISPEKAYDNKMKYNREIIKHVVQDMKNRGLDPVYEFENPKTRSLDYLELKEEDAEMLAARYRENIDLYGQIEAPKEGEMSLKEKLAKGGNDSKSKSEAKRLKAEAKAKAAAEKKAQQAAAKAAAAETKAAAKAEKERAKAEAKAEKERAKAAAAALAVAGENIDQVVADDAEDDAAVADADAETGQSRPVQRGRPRCAHSPPAAHTVCHRE